MPLVTEAFVGGQFVTACPLCYGQDIRRMTGRPWEPQGQIAAMMLEEAQRTRIRR